MFTHICVNFTGNKVHAELVSGMAKRDGRHVHVFVPCKSRALFGRNDPRLPNVTVKYFYVPPFLRYFQLLKVAYVTAFILLFAWRHDIDLRANRILAHTFWSDGVLAYLINKIYRCGYIVTIRNTDINVFFKYGYHLRPIMRAIGAAARGVTSPSAAYIARTGKFSWLRLDPGKLHFVPNPISEWWYESIRDEALAQCTRDNLQGCFVGEFNQNKNIRSVVSACAALREKGIAIKLVCAGGTAQQFKDVTGLTSLPTWIEVKGRIQDRRELAELYRQSRFLAVPSFRETFGMVYLEAISQGCIIICSKGQGVDGIFDDPQIQYSVKPSDIENIESAIMEAVRSDYRSDPARCEQLLHPFSITSVVGRYQAIACLEPV